MNIITELKNAIPANLLPSISQTLGESEDSISKALNGIFPALVGGILNKAEAPNGQNILGSLVSLLKEAPSIDVLRNNYSHLLDNLTSQIDVNSISGKFSSLIFGDNKLREVTSLLSNFSGIKENSIASLINMAIPLVTGLLGKTAATAGIPGLISLLTEQKSNIAATLPSGLNNILGVADLKHSASKYIESGKDLTVKRKSWLLPLIILALLALAATLLFKSCSKTDVSDGLRDTQANVNNTVGQTTNTVKQATSETVDSIKDSWAKLGSFFKIALPGGETLNVPQLGVENKLITYLNSDNSTIDPTKWFSFDRLVFETGSTQLNAISDEQLDNIAKIMKAYPGIEVKLGGYTDNTGNPASNLKLSQDRADTVKNKLINLGIDGNRIVAVGYGEEHPVADNDTPENRAKNRRIDINVTKK